MGSTPVQSNSIKVILIGVGGATCSGKTTLAKHLRTVLPNSFIIHQDDFAPPQELVPYHPTYNVQDWDDAPGAIQWPRLESALKHVREHGSLPEGHYSHDHLNEQKKVPISDDILRHWSDKFSAIEESWRVKDVRIVWALLDGFLLYWDKAVVDTLDVRVFLNVPEEVLKKRRNERHGYHTAEGSLWRDPPQYWEQIVYPAYVRAHERMFKDGNVEAAVPVGSAGR